MRDFDLVVARATERLDLAGEEPTRLFHGRGHCFEGYEDITVDWFAPHLLVSAYGADVAGPQQLAAKLAAAVPAQGGVCLQVRDGRQTRAEIVSGQVPDRHVVCERGLNYLVRMTRNQNVGLFLDMAPVRSWLREQAQGKRVLNLFAFTCAFSVAAMAGGATLVVNNDMARRPLDWGRENHRLNGHDLNRVRMLPHDLFKCWRKIRQLGPYDLVIIDPPTNQRGSFTAERDYARILRRLPELSAPGARILACLNSPFLNQDFLAEQMARWCPACTPVASMLPSADFPDRYPDRGLKMSLFRYSP